MVLGSGSLLPKPYFSFLISKHRAKSSQSNCIFPASARFSQASQSITAVWLGAPHLFCYECVLSTLLEYHQIRTGRGKAQRARSQIALPGHPREQIKSFGHSAVLHTAHNTTGVGQPSHHCSSPSQEPKGNCPWPCQPDDAVQRFGPHL